MFVTRRILLSTLPHVKSSRVQEIGLITASTIKTRHIGIHLFSELRFIFGGKMEWYTEMFQESRKEVTDDLLVQANKLGADAVLGIRYQNSTIIEGASEIMVYGTAVKYLDNFNSDNDNNNTKLI